MIQVKYKDANGQVTRDKIYNKYVAMLETHGVKSQAQTDLQKLISYGDTDLHMKIDQTYDKGFFRVERTIYFE